MVTFVSDVAFNLGAFEIWPGQTTFADQTGWRVEDGYRTGDYYGTGITYDWSAGGAVSGTVTSYYEYHGGNLAYSFTNTSYPAVSLVSLVNSGDSQTLVRYLLGGDDHISGSDFGDTLYGFDGDDVIHAGSGNDNLSGLKGTNIIDGGDGTDFVYLLGPGNEYTLGTESGYLTIVDQTGYSTDYVTNVERLIFSNGTLHIDGISSQVYRLYQAAFDRTPDNDGLKHNITLIDEGMSLGQMANAFVYSEEFARLHGYQTGDAEFINALYNNVLDRDADLAGFQGWSGRMTHDGWSRADVLIGFSDSQENINLTSPYTDDGIWLV